MESVKTPCGRLYGWRETSKISPMNSDSPRSQIAPSLPLFLAVALLSGAVLGFEVALTRVFAVLLRYQFAFLVVSLALCGLGLGGLFAFLRPKTSLEGAALGWGLSAALSLALILRGVFAFAPQHYWIAALLVLVPFVAAGAFLSLVFGRFSDQMGRLYAYDLAGAALAAAFAVGLMQLVGAINACLIFAALGALAGALVSEKKAFPAVIAMILLLCAPYNALFGLWDVPPIPPNFDSNGASLADRGVTQPLYTEIGAQIQRSRETNNPKLPRTQILDTRWNAFARTDVVYDPDAGADTRLIYTNGNVPTNMLAWNGRVSSIPELVREFPLSDWTFENANLNGANVLSIGPGGGLDALLALRYGAKRFEGAEINPSIVALMNEPKYREFTGGIYARDEVHVETAEGRAFVREAAQNGKRYRLIFSALTKTATAGQGAALLESFIYTQEAFADYERALDADGTLAIVGDSPALMARLGATAMQGLMARGETMTEREAGSHIALAHLPENGPYQWALLVKKRPFSVAETQKMSESAAKRGLQAVWIPGRSASNPYFPFGSLFSGALTLDGFIGAGLQPMQGAPNGIDLSPAPDDRPFVLDLTLSPFSIFQSSPSLSILLGLSMAATLVFAGLMLGNSPRAQKSPFQTPASPDLEIQAPLAGASGEDLAPTTDSARGILPVVYFLCLGLGFILIEIPLIQKLILPLGYPTLSLGVILFSLLLGGGAGALFSQKFEGEALREYALKCALGVAITSVVFGLFSSVFGALLLGLPLVARCLAVALLLLPLGFLMGAPFPSGLRLLARGERAVALAWALNGTASVAASIGAAVGAKMGGFGAVLTLGAGFYLVAAAILGFYGRKTDSVKSSAQSDAQI